MTLHNDNLLESGLPKLFIQHSTIRSELPPLKNQISRTTVSKSQKSTEQ